MSQCIQCQHWSLRDTEPSLARAGFAQCLVRARGNMPVAGAEACRRFSGLPEAEVDTRRAWLAERKGRDADRQV